MKQPPTASGPVSPTSLDFARETTSPVPWADGHVFTIKQCLVAGMVPSHMPRMINKHVAKSTRLPMTAEQNFVSRMQLQQLFPFGGLLKTAQDKLLEVPHFQRWILEPIDSQFVHSVHPHYTGMGLPRVLRSEADSTSWINAKFMWPAIIVIHGLMRLMHNHSDDDLPQVSSCNATNNRGTPDGILILPEHGINMIKSTFEWKTHNALKDTSMRDAYRDILKIYELYKISTPFLWKPSDWSAADTATRVIAQLWGQMVVRSEHADDISGKRVEADIDPGANMPARQVRFSCLSSCQQTTFFCRNGEGPGVLYMSQPMEFEQMTVLKYAAMLALALGITKLEPNDFPPWDRDMYGQMMASHPASSDSQPGLDLRLSWLYHQQLQQQHLKLMATRASQTQQSLKPDTETTNTKGVYRGGRGGRRGRRGRRGRAGRAGQAK